VDEYDTPPIIAVIVLPLYAGINSKSPILLPFLVTTQVDGSGAGVPTDGRLEVSTIGTASSTVDPDVLGTNLKDKKLLYLYVQLLDDLKVSDHNTMGVVFAKKIYPLLGCKEVKLLILDGTRVSQLIYDEPLAFKPIILLILFFHDALLIAIELDPR
jgi:hypothetical protein